MRYYLLLIALLAAVSSGCQTSGNSQIPAVDPFAMYGHTRIAPPTTGSYGVVNQNPYYPGAAQVQPASAELQFAENSANRSQELQAFSVVDATKTPSHEAAHASYESPAEESNTNRVASNEAPIRVVERVGPLATNSPDFRGMTAVDASHSTASFSSQANSATYSSELSHAAASEPALFHPAENAAPIPVLPSERPLPVRGFSAPSMNDPNPVPQPTPSALQPSATIQAGRFIPLNIATNRASLPSRETVAANAGN